MKRQEGWRPLWTALARGWEEGKGEGRKKYQRRRRERERKERENKHVDETEKFDGKLAQEAPTTVK